MKSRRLDRRGGPITDIAKGDSRTLLDDGSSACRPYFRDRYRGTMVDVSDWVAPGPKRSNRSLGALIVHAQ
jgi:hypothetical protein